MTSPGITLHVGLPKCASSALQDWADANRDALATAGMDYPPAPDGLPAPKHQQMIGALYSGDLAPVEELLAAWTAPRLLLSSEGLSNHLYEFEPGHLARLRELLAGRCETVVLMVRDHETWIGSMWRQCLLNPYRPSAAYGLDLTQEAFARLPRWQAFQDLSQLGQDLLAAYGARRLVQIDSRGDWLSQLKDALGIDLTAPLSAERRNVSIGDAEAELLRRLNGVRPPEPTRGRIMALMQLATGQPQRHPAPAGRAFRAITGGASARLAGALGDAGSRG